MHRKFHSDIQNKMEGNNGTAAPLERDYMKEDSIYLFFLFIFLFITFLLIIVTIIIIISLLLSLSSSLLLYCFVGFGVLISSQVLDEFKPILVP